MCMAPQVVGVSVEQRSMLVQVRLQLPPHQVVAFLLLEVHCRRQVQRSSHCYPSLLPHQKEVLHSLVQAPVCRCPNALATPSVHITPRGIMISIHMLLRKRISLSLRTKKITGNSFCWQAHSCQGGWLEKNRYGAGQSLGRM